MTKLTTAAALSLGSIAGMLLVRSQMGTPAALLSAGRVRPENVVHLDSEGSCTSAAPHVIFQVPSDKWFILTDWSSTSYTLECGSFVCTQIRLVENLGGVVTRKLGSRRIQNYYDQNCGGGPSPYPFTTAEGPFHSSVGIPFAPGSNVELRPEGGSCSKGAAWYSMTGYLVPE